MKKFVKVITVAVLSVLALIIAFTLLNFINALFMSSYAKSFEKVEYSSQLTPTKENGETYFVTDGEFKIMQITDVHIVGSILSVSGDRKALNAVASMITSEKPDLVVITGDISFAVPYLATINNHRSHSLFITLMENLGVYYTVAFGNHDSEFYNVLSRSKVASLYESEDLTYSLFSRNDGETFGECNHVINVKNSLGLIRKSIIVLDTNAYATKKYTGTSSGYDNIHEDQIAWYESTVLSLKTKNQETYDNLSPDKQENQTPEVKSLAFFHIPPTEVNTAYQEYVANGNANTEDVIYKGGYSGEKVCSSDVDDEFFETALSLQSTQAMFYGHDHVNNYVLSYKGITLSYGYSVDYSAYIGIYKKGAQRGCTIININPSNEFEIIHENYYQDKYPSKYKKEKVNMERN